MNKRILSVILVCIIILLSITACSVGVTHTESREISDVNAVSINTIGEFVIRQGDAETLTIEGPNNILRHITTEVVGGTLYIDSERGVLSDSFAKVVYTLTVKNLNEISLSGAGSISISSLDSTDLDVTLTGAGSITVRSLNTQNLSVLLNSAGSISISGNAVNQNVVLSGVGSYDASDLQSQTAKVVMSGAGSAEVWVSDALDIEVSGVGSVSYFGSPSVTQNISGLGSVNSKGEK
jgi:phage-related protein